MAAKNKTSRTRHGSPIVETSVPGDASRQERRRSAREDAKTPRRQPCRESRTLTRRDALGILALSALVVGSYVPAFFAGFVWDDEIITEAVVRDWSGLWHIWFSPAEITREGHYWPLVYTTFWLEHKLWGYAPTGYHVVNVVLHLGNALLLWRLAGRLTVPGAWLLAAVFAVHPLHVESVAWVIERKDLLSTLFYLAAFSTWVHFVEEPRPEFGRRRYLLALALFVLGLLCKSIVVTLPAALLIWHWWQRGRVTATDLLRVTPFFVVGLVTVVADTRFYQSREAVSLGYSIIERVLIAAHALWFYAGKLLWPVDLAVIYPHWEVSVADPWAWVYVVAAGAMAAGLWVLRHRVGRGPLAGVLFFAVTLLPVLGFVDYGYMQFSFVADRYQYLAGIGVTAVLVGAAAHGAGRLPATWRQGAAGVAAVILIVLGTLTWRQAGVYRDEVTFFTHVVSYNPTARGAQQNLGHALLAVQRPEEGLVASLTATEQDPDDVKAHANVGVALIRLGRLNEAEKRLRHALTLDPRSMIVIQNLGEALRKQGRFEEALEFYRTAIRRDSGNALPHAAMGHTLFHLRRYEESLHSLNRALELDPTLETVRDLRESTLTFLRRTGDDEVHGVLHEK